MDPRAKPAQEALLAGVPERVASRKCAQPNVESDSRSEARERPAVDDLRDPAFDPPLRRPGDPAGRADRIVAQARTAPRLTDVGAHAPVVLGHLTTGTLGEPDLGSHASAVWWASLCGRLTARSAAHIAPSESNDGDRLVNASNRARYSTSAVVPCARRKR
jgi:hypothetical protein